jgi:hypothetical protein
MARSLRVEDEGKRVARPNGSVLGSIATVEDGIAYVRPKSGLMDGWSSWICGPPCDGAAFPLDHGVMVDVDGEVVIVEPEQAPLAVGKK